MELINPLLRISSKLLRIDKTNLDMVKLLSADVTKNRFSSWGVPCYKYLLIRVTSKSVSNVTRSNIGEIQIMFQSFQNMLLAYCCLHLHKNSNYNFTKTIIERLVIDFVNIPLEQTSINITSYIRLHSRLVVSILNTKLKLGLLPLQSLAAIEQLELVIESMAVVLVDLSQSNPPAGMRRHAAYVKVFQKRTTPIVYCDLFKKMVSKKTACRFRKVLHELLKILDDIEWPLIDAMAANGQHMEKIRNYRKYIQATLLVLGDLKLNSQFRLLTRFHKFFT
ncbi:Mei4p KNAG_0L01290 [Huiozyma naganishii CBS 8797]|uniref:Uncharacterized protein n=1 Tax=Huiozyma naganishii (strain ATCC MYA-139 / BCRC 22969 / CBS 8797 / KCTC 17520 / NBRC 10181 / NCYC 3082 / Yp74L-3) TaxID=1071383 RepID=J7SAH2_HUIN7|nr:hypothetical protein KNAG_0L01290 [Kazachstania naganishii CBS 8797]CCK72749.1 hypothetical protein KNAG_0L01290 [Kazachstania naganishii CBS 8797]